MMKKIFYYEITEIWMEYSEFSNKRITEAFMKECHRKPLN